MIWYSHDCLCAVIYVMCYVDRLEQPFHQISVFLKFLKSHAGIYIFTSNLFSLVYMIVPEMRFWLTNNVPYLQVVVFGPLFLLLFRLSFFVVVQVTGFPSVESLGGGGGGALQNSMGGSLRNGVLNILVKSLKRSVWVFDVTNRKNGFSNFQSYHWVVMYLFNSLAKSCTLFWKYS